MVAGGADNSGRLMSSTETLLVGSDGWEPANSLPAAVEGLRGVTIGDDIFLTGGKADNGTRSYVLRYIVARNKKYGQTKICPCCNSHQSWFRDPGVL